MWDLSGIGRIFYGTAMAGLGFLTIYYNDFPYMFFSPQHFLITLPEILTYILGTIMMLAGFCIVINKKTRPVSLLLGCVLLFIFLFDYIPYEFMANSSYRHLAEWENAEKELALAGGAFVISSFFTGKVKNLFNRFWRKLLPFGNILFSIPMISFGILHFLYTKEASTLVPAWIPGPIFWTYLAGLALMGSGLAIILKIKPVLISNLLGVMIFIWFIILHIPRVIVSSSADLGGEIASALLALAYSGIALVIAGAAGLEA